MRNRNIISFAIIVCIAFAFLPQKAGAMYAPLTYRYKHFLFEVDPDDYPSWLSEKEQWSYLGTSFRPPANLRVDGDSIPPLPTGVMRSSTFAWDEGAIRATLDLQIARLLNREPGEVTIDKSGDEITFEGIGLPGRKLNLAEAAELTVEALRRGVIDITLPVSEIQPQINVLSTELQDSGIQEVLSVGESDFRGSPYNRKHNIAVGLDSFNGHVIPQGEIFSFNEVLGPVNSSTGYKQELVIKGDKTLPDFGGGLCQVSTTAYRGVWEYGFPIEQRKNHSFSVRYYFPQGTDATIYPPYKDVKFLNDSLGDILIQTFNEDGRAYFIYFGTKDKRQTEVIGPYMWGEAAPPPDRIERTTDIPPGTTRKVGERVPGVRAGWLRVVMNEEGEQKKEQVFSIYEARPRYTQIGVTEEELNPPVIEPEPEIESENKSGGWYQRWRRGRD